MKSIVLCETSLVKQTETIMEEEKPKNDSGGVPVVDEAEILKKHDGDRSENSAIPGDAAKSCRREDSDSREKEETIGGKKKELTNGDADDSVNGRTDRDSDESPVECDSNVIKKDVDSYERTKIPEESDAKSDVNIVNKVTNTEVKTEKSEESRVEKNGGKDADREISAEADGHEKDAASTGSASEAEPNASEETVVDLESERDARKEKAGESKDLFCGENGSVGFEKELEEIPMSNGTSVRGDESLSESEISSDRPANVSKDGAFDEEGNKENEKADSDKTAEVFAVEDNETTEIGRTSEESGSSKYNIHVSDCQSVSVQDEDVSWGELQNAESSKDYEADASDESKEPGDYCPEPEEIEIEENSKPIEECAEVENREEETKMEEEEEERSVSEGRYERENEIASTEDRFALDEASVEIDGESAIREEEEEEIEEEEDSVAASEKTEGESRKRSGSEKPEESETEPKRRKTEEEEGISYVGSEDEDEDEDVDDPLPCSSPPTFSEDSDAQVESCEKEKKRNLNVEEPIGESEPKKLKLSTDESEKCSEKTKTNLEECIDRVATNKRTLPFLENLRGTLKNLTRSDLEELTVQKLCEVITERSTVGELRRRAQALEQDQEKWKEKVQSLTKQMREMEMVMKKYMSEVQKQNKEKNFQIVTPIRVTRSVGLQVNKGPRIPPGQNSSPNAAAQSDKRPGVKSGMPVTPLQTNPNTLKPNIRNKPLTPTTSPRTLLSPQKNIVQVKKNFPPRPGANPLPQNRPIAPQPLMNSNRLQQNQMTNIRPAFKIAAVAQPQQTGSKVIDLTDDDDKQMNQKAFQVNAGARNPPGTVRVVNSLQQTQLNQNSRVAYLVPATTTSTTTSGTGTPNRQFVIATSGIPTQNRQIVSSMPPLIFKGGNFVPAGAQATLVNQNVRPLAPKQFRHPAPLPQPPANQIHRPNWKLLPPRPALKISRVQTGIVLSWNMNLGPEYEAVASYQLYAYQESNSPPTTSLWKKVGDVKALPLPMACTLTQFMTGHKYHFAVRAVDVHSRIGPFSVPNFIVL